MIILIKSCFILASESQSTCSKFFSLGVPEISLVCAQEAMCPAEGTVRINKSVYTLSKENILYRNFGRQRARGIKRNGKRKKAKVKGKNLCMNKSQNDV